MTTIPIFPKETYTRKEAIQYLNIPEKHFDNYLKFSKEIKGQKQANRRWSFKKTDLDIWKSQKEENTVTLSMKIYEECFEFAIRMVYSGLSARGSGIRGTRSEVQIADDVILGILGEYGVKKFLKDKVMNFS